MKSNATISTRAVEAAAVAFGAAAVAIGAGILALSLAPGAPELLSLPTDAEIMSNGRANADAAIVPLAATLTNVAFFAALMWRLRSQARAAAQSAPEVDTDGEDDGRYRAQIRAARAAQRTMAQAMRSMGVLAIAWTIVTDLVRNALRLWLAAAGHVEGLKLHLDPDLPLIAVGVALLLAAQAAQRAQVDADIARTTV